MWLVSEQERRNLAAVGASKAATMLASVAYTEDPYEDTNFPEAPQLVGVAIPPEQGDKSKRIDISQEQPSGTQLRTEQVANMADNAQSYTRNSIRGTEHYMSYVLHKDGIGKVRVLYKPTVCKGLIKCHECPVVDHSLKITRFLKSDTERGAVVASLDTCGLLAITAFNSPSQEGQLQKLSKRSEAKVQFKTDCMPDAQAKAALGQPIGVVDIGVGYVYVALGSKLLCIDVEKLIKASEGEPVDVDFEKLPTGVTLLAATAGDFTSLVVHPCGHEVAAGTTLGSVHVVPAHAPLPSAIFEVACEGEAAPDTPQPRPVSHVAYFGCASVADDVVLGKSSIVTAVAQPCGSLQLSTWAVNLFTEDTITAGDVPQVLPVDALCLHASEAAKKEAPACMRGGWVVRVHPNGWSQGLSGVIIAAQSADERGEMHVITATVRTELVRWVRATIGTTVVNFEVTSMGEMTEKSPSTVTESIQNIESGEASGDAVALVLRLSHGVATATIPCAQLAPPLPSALPDALPQSQGDDVLIQATQLEGDAVVEPPQTEPEERSGAGSFCSAASPDIAAVEASLAYGARGDNGAAPVATAVATEVELPSLKEFVQTAVASTGGAAAAGATGTSTTTMEPPVATTEHVADINALTEPGAGTQMSEPLAVPDAAPTHTPVPQVNLQHAAEAAPVATVATAQLPVAVEGSSLLSSLLQQAGGQEAAAPAVPEPLNSQHETPAASSDWAFQSGPVRPSQRGFNVAESPNAAPLNGSTPPASERDPVQPSFLEPPVPDPGPPSPVTGTRATTRSSGFPAVTVRTNASTTAAATTVAAPVSVSMLPQDLFVSLSEQAPVAAAAPVATQATTTSPQLPPALRSEGSLVEALLGASNTSVPSRQHNAQDNAPAADTSAAGSHAARSVHAPEDAPEEVEGGWGVPPQVPTPAGSERGEPRASQLLLSTHETAGGQRVKADGVSVSATPRGADSPNRMSGDSMARGVASSKLLEKLDKRMHDSTNIVRGLQSSVTKLQNEVNKNNTEMAKALKAQSAVERAVRGIEGSLEKMPTVMSAAVAQGLQDSLPAAVSAHVSNVVAEAFRAAFTGSIVPAFEQAMHVMFTQVDEAVNQGLAEHLAATRAAMESPPAKAARVHAPPAATAPQHIIHNLRPGSIDLFNPPLASAQPQPYPQQQPQQTPAAPAATAAGPYAQPHMHGLPVSHLAAQTVSISDIVDSGRQHGSDLRSSGMHPAHARAFQSGPAQGYAGAPTANPGAAAPPTSGQDPNRYGQPLELQPFSMGGTTGATPVEGGLLAGAIEGSQKQRHEPAGRHNAPFQAAPDPVQAAAPSPIQKAQPVPSVGKELKELIQLQNYPAVGEYCKRTPASTASLLSPLHAACVSDMLCPAIEAASGQHGNEAAIVQLLEWLRGCVGHLLPEHGLQQGLIREILIKSQTAVRGVMERSGSGEVIRICLPAGKLLSSRLAAFPAS